MPSRIVILGAGISGLSTAWFLKNYLGAEANIQLLEKNDRPGGWIQTIQNKEFLFEQGPRSCRSKGLGQETLALIEALGIQEQVIVPHADACYRYIYQQNTLMRLPRHPWGIPFYSLTRGWMQALWKDWWNPKRQEEDESIYSFFSRRLGKKWAERLADPFVLGIYAGDCRRLSMKSCFPLFDEWERRQSSLIRGAWHHRPSCSIHSAFIQSISRFPMFSFKEGMETLTRALASELNEHLLLEHPVKSLEVAPSAIHVHLENGTVLQADYLVSTLSAASLATLLPAHPAISKRLTELPYASVIIINLGFDTSVLPLRGFGYLIPTSMGERVLGCVWDSCIFPQQNERPYHTRMTMMMGGSCHPEMEGMSENALIELALKSLYRHLGIRVSPKAIQVKRAQEAIPQYEVGYSLWRMSLQEKIKQLSPRLLLSGSAWNGVSINDCVKQARMLAQEMVEKI